MAGPTHDVIAIPVAPFELESPATRHRGWTDACALWPLWSCDCAQSSKGELATTLHSCLHHTHGSRVVFSVGFVQKHFNQPTNFVRWPAPNWKDFHQYFAPKRIIGSLYRYVYVWCIVTFYRHISSPTPHLTIAEYMIYAGFITQKSAPMTCSNFFFV
jgi:hypothetical protein